MHLNYFSQASDSRDCYPGAVRGKREPSPSRSRVCCGEPLCASARHQFLPSPPSFPPPGVRISPKCWRSVTCMFNSFQKHRKAICRREASGSPGRAVPLSAALPRGGPARCAAPLCPGRSEPAPPEPRCRPRSMPRTWGSAHAKSAPLSPSQVYSELKLLPPLYFIFFLCPLSRAVNKARFLVFAESCCRTRIEPGLT